MLEAQHITRDIPERSWDDHRMTASFDSAPKYENLDLKKLQFPILLRNRALRSIPTAPSRRASMLDFNPARNYGQKLPKNIILYEKCRKSCIFWFTPHFYPQMGGVYGTSIYNSHVSFEASNMSVLFVPYRQLSHNYFGEREGSPNNYNQSSAWGGRSGMEVPKIWLQDSWTTRIQIWSYFVEAHSEL